MSKVLSALEKPTPASRKSTTASIPITPELAWVLSPFARVPEEFRTYGEGVNAELDRAKEVQERIYATPQTNPNPKDMGGHDYHCEGEELGVCHGGPDHTSDCPDYQLTDTTNTDADNIETETK